MQFHTSAVIYARVSTKKQKGHNEYSIDVQQSICSNEYKRLFPGRDEPKVVSEHGSSFNDQNKLQELDKLIGGMKEGTLLIVHDISRLGRNIYQTIKRVYEPIELKKCYIYSVMEDKFFGVHRLDDVDFFKYSIDAEVESIRKSELTKRRIKVLKSRGSHFGRVPFGKKTVRENGILVLKNNPEEQEVIKIIKAKARENERNNATKVKKGTAKFVVEHLNRRGIKNRGKNFTIAHVRKILKPSLNNEVANLRI